MTEYLNWYNPGDQMMRCQTCGALLASGDTELHSKYHRQIIEAFQAHDRTVAEGFAKVGDALRTLAYRTGGRL